MRLLSTRRSVQECSLWLHSKLLKAENNPEVHHQVNESTNWCAHSAEKPLDKKERATDSHVHTRRFTHPYTPIHTSIHADSHIHTGRFTHPYTLIHTSIHTDSHIHTRRFTHPYTRIHTSIRTDSHIHTHGFTHPYTQPHRRILQMNPDTQEHTPHDFTFKFIKGKISNRKHQLTAKGQGEMWARDVFYSIVCKGGYTGGYICHGSLRLECVHFIACKLYLNAFDWKWKKCERSY